MHGGDLLQGDSGGISSGKSLMRCLAGSPQAVQVSALNHEPSGAPLAPLTQPLLILQAPSRDSETGIEDRLETSHAGRGAPV